MYWAKVSQNTDVLRSGWDVLVISGQTFFGKVFFDVRSNCILFVGGPSLDIGERKGGEGTSMLIHTVTALQE